MALAKKPDKVKLFVGMITRYDKLFACDLSKLEERLGKIDLESDTFPFDYTDYYQKDMGKGLKRKFYSFEHIIDPAELPDIKNFTNEVEKIYVGRDEFEVPRPLNIDPGYLTLSGLVLASMKDYAHRIYIGENVYAEVTLTWKRDKGFEPMAWTYPDYKSSGYLNFFTRVRDIYYNQIRLDL